MRFACRVTKATDTHSEYVILTALTLQQRLQERATRMRIFASLVLAYDAASRGNLILTCRRNGLHL
jgi:hypothetical protein